MRFAELKFTLDKWRKGEFDVGRNDVKRSITVLSKGSRHHLMCTFLRCYLGILYQKRFVIIITINTVMRPDGVVVRTLHYKPPNYGFESG